MARKDLDDTYDPMSWSESVLFVMLLPVFFMLCIFAALMIMASSGLVEWFEDDCE